MTASGHPFLEWAGQRLELPGCVVPDQDLEQQLIEHAHAANGRQNANQRVFATLFCETGVAPVEHNTDLAGVPLEPNGDFRIDDTLSPVPPNTCTSPVLLIRSAASGSWFAAGIPK